MNKHWIVVAHRAGARVFEENSSDLTLRVVERFENAIGKVKTSERVSDRQGRSEHSGASSHTAMGDADGQKNKILNTFVSKICTFLDLESGKNRFESLTLVAEAQVLGALRKSLGKPAEMRLKKSLSKDLVHVSDHDMAAQLKLSL